MTVLRTAVVAVLFLFPMSQDTSVLLAFCLVLLGGLLVLFQPSCGILFILMDIVILVVWYLVKRCPCLCESKFEGTFMCLLAMVLARCTKFPGPLLFQVPLFLPSQSWL